MKIRLFLYLAAVTIASLGCSSTGKMGSGIETKGLDDDSEPLIWVSSFGFDKPRPFQEGTADPFLRAQISRERGTVNFYEVDIRCNSRSDKLDYKIGFIIDGEFVRRRIISIADGTECSQFGCSNYETVVMDITREELDWVAHDDGQIRVTSGAYAWYVDFDANEVLIFLAEVDQVVARLP